MRIFPTVAAIVGTSDMVVGSYRFFNSPDITNYKRKKFDYLRKEWMEGRDPPKIPGYTELFEYYTSVT